MAILARKMDTESAVTDMLNAVVVAIDLDVSTTPFVDDHYRRVHRPTSEIAA